MRVLGVDPGYAIAGYGVVERAKTGYSVITFGAVTTPSHTPFEDRLSEIYDDFCSLFAAYQPDAMAIETLFFTTNKTTAMAVAQARGVILLAAKQAGVPMFEYNPLQVKQGVAGYGKATKKQVQDMVKRLLHLKKTPQPDDAADALAIALCHAHASGSLQFGRHVTKRQKMGYY